MVAFMHVIPGWLELISLAFCTGVLVCRLLVFPPSADASSICEDRLADVWRLFRMGIYVMIACTSSNLVVRAVEMSGAPVLSVFPVLQTVLLRTHFGLVWIVRIATEVLSLISLILAGRRDSKLFLAFMLALMAVISATESASGHASDTGDFSIQEISDWLHLIAASVWGGGLLVLSFFLLPEIVKPGLDQTAFQVSGAAQRFSRIAGLAVGTILITALYNGFYYVGSLEALLKSSYGLTVIAKILLFLSLICLGGFNRYISVPLLQEWADASKKYRPAFTRVAIRFSPRLLLEGPGYRTAQRFMRSVKVEAVLIIAVLLCAALLRHEVPARHLHHLGHADGKPMQMHEGKGAPPVPSDRFTH